MILLIFLQCLLITIIVEGVAIFIIFRRKDYIYYSVLCNVLTNPAMNLVLLSATNFIGAKAYLPALILSETAVVAVESGVYNYLCRFGILKSTVLSIGLNALSFAAGLFY